MTYSKQTDLLECFSTGIYLLYFVRYDTNNKEYFMKANKPAENPTIEFYGHLDSAFDFFNNRLFAGELPKVMFELTNKKRVGGYFKSKAWQSVDDTFVHTIAINPQYIVHSTPLQVYSTIVHEAAHLWQHVYGEVGRGNYHNTEWADKMESIGLMPSSTSRPGGKRTGQSMGDYPIPGSLFEQACVDFLLEGNFISFVDASVDQAEVLKFRNQLMQECIDKGQSLAEHFNNFQYTPAPENIAPVIHVDIDDYLDNLAENTGSGPAVAGLPKADLDGSKSSAEGDFIRDLAIKTSAYDNSDDWDDWNASENTEAADDAIDKMNTQMALLVTKPIEDTISISVKVDEEEVVKKDKKKKVTYECLGCSSKVWGKPNLSILCINCEIPYEPT